MSEPLAKMGVAQILASEAHATGGYCGADRMRRYAFGLSCEVCGEMDGCRLDFSPTAEAIELVTSVDSKEVEGFGLWSLFTDVLMDELRHASTCRTEVRSTGGTLADGVWWR